MYFKQFSLDLQYKVACCVFSTKDAVVVQSNRGKFCQKCLILIKISFVINFWPFCAQKPLTLVQTLGTLTFSYMSLYRNTSQPLGQESISKGIYSKIHNYQNYSYELTMK